VILVTRYVSLGSLLGSATMIPAVALVFLVLNGTIPPAYLIYAVVGVGVVWLAHADNIDRLLHGTERKFDLSLLSGRGGGVG
jgi:glycerol-3-phosphate acyltransferase PlsY